MSEHLLLVHASQLSHGIDSNEASTQLERVDNKRPHSGDNSPPEHKKAKAEDVNWGYDDLFWEDPEPLLGDFNAVFDYDRIDLDTTKINIITEIQYKKIESPIKVEWSKKDQSSRFVESFRSPMVSHKKIIGVTAPLQPNPDYHIDDNEMVLLEKNASIWFNMIKNLGIEKKSDLEFIMRPDFPDVMSQILGVAGKGLKPVLETDYQFHLRLPPSLIENSILQVKKELRDPVKTADYRQRIHYLARKNANQDKAEVDAIVDNIVSLYSSYEPMDEKKPTQHDDVGILNFKVTPKKDELRGKKVLKLEYKDYKTRENIIGKHILRHFAPNKHVSTYIVKRMRKYDSNVNYVRNLATEVHQYDNIPFLRVYEKNYANYTDTELFLHYRRQYLKQKSAKRLLIGAEVRHYGYYSLDYVRSTLHKYDNTLKNHTLAEKKILVITTDKTINDIVFRNILNSKASQITVYGDFNYNRVGENYNQYTYTNNHLGKRTIKCYPTNLFNIDTRCEDYDFVIIDTVSLAVLRNTIVYGDYQEAHQFANIVMQRIHNAAVHHGNIRTRLILRAGLANIGYTKEPLSFELMRIERIDFFKATGPEAIITFTSDTPDAAHNARLIRRSILMKMLVLQDIEKLSRTNLGYYVKPLEGYYTDAYHIMDDDKFLRLSNRKGFYVPYSKTRHTHRYSDNVGADIIYTYLSDFNLRATLHEAALRKHANQKTISDDKVGKPLSIFMASGTRQSKIVAALVKCNYSINDAYLELNNNGDYRASEIQDVFNKCLTIPISDTNALVGTHHDLLQSIRYVVRYNPTLATYKEKYKNLHSMIDTYFETRNDRLYFRGITEAVEDDVQDPLCINAIHIYEYRKNDIMSDNKRTNTMIDTNVSVDDDFNPPTPVYNPVSPNYAEENMELMN